MTNAEIAERLTELMARSDADNVMLQVMIGQFAADHGDWRESLDKMRMSCEATLQRGHGPGPEGAALRQRSLAHVEETFRALRQFLLANERRKLQP